MSITSGPDGPDRDGCGTGYVGTSTLIDSKNLGSFMFPEEPGLKMIEEESDSNPPNSSTVTPIGSGSERCALLELKRPRDASSAPPPRLPSVGH